MANKKKRISICYLTSHIMYGIGMDQYMGITDAAKDYDVDIICIAGWRLNDPNGFLSSANIAYDLIDENKYDGIISWSSDVGSHYLPEKDVEAFYKQKFTKIPVIHIGYKIAGNPVILMNDHDSIKTIIKHLVEVHGCTKIGFVRGPDDRHLSSKRRYNAYLETLKEYGIRINDRLISMPGGFARQTGINAANLLFSERKLKVKKDIEAIIAVSDVFAIPLIIELKNRGIKVPDDIYITGFNNSNESRTCEPPLTSIDSQSYLLGYRSVECLLDRLKNKKKDEEILIPTKLIIRQSCGCIESSVRNAGEHQDKVKLEKKDSLRNSETVKKKSIVSELKRIINIKDGCMDKEWALNLLNCLINEISSGKNIFLSCLRNYLNKFRTENEDLLIWQEVISVLRKSMKHLVSDKKFLIRSENLFHQARVLINQASEYSIYSKRDELIKLVLSLGTITTALTNTFDVMEIMDLLEKVLKDFNIHYCYLSLYETGLNPAENARLIFAYKNNQRLMLGPYGNYFRSTELIPEYFYVKGRRRNLFLKPLYFRTHQIGLILFESQEFNSLIYEILCSQLSSALQGALNIQERKEIEHALMESEDRFRNMVETSSDWIWQIDYDLKYTYTSPRINDILGYAPVEILGKSPMDFVSKYNKFTAGIFYKKILNDYSYFFHVEHAYMSKSGKIVIIESSGAPIFDIDKNIIGYQGVNRDITQQKKAESENESLLKSLEYKNVELEQKVEERTKDLKNLNEKLTAAIDEAVKANHAKSKFLANMSHEIRTPLNCIVGFSELLNGTNDRNQKEFFINLIYQESGKLTELINQLLDISKIEAGKIIIKSYPFSIFDFINSIKSVFTVMAENKGLSFFIHADGNIPEFINADVMRLHQILNNLIGNAIKFTSRGKVELFLELLEKNDHSVKLKFTISDTGIGIKKDMLENIFNVFVQADDDITRNFGGTGLGTAISKELVQLMGGNIGVNSEVGKGSEFWFTVNLNIAENIDPGQTAKDYYYGNNFYFNKNGFDLNPLINQSPARQTIDPAQGAGVVLLAEDYHLNMKLTVDHLIKMGFRVIEAENGAIAVEKFLHNNVDLVLMDVQMPVKDGYEATREIRNSESGKNIPIIGITANVFQPDIQNCLDSGMNDVITKPFRKKELYDKIMSWLVKSGKRLNKDSESMDEKVGIKNEAGVKSNEDIINLNKLKSEFNNNIPFIMELFTEFLLTGRKQMSDINDAVKLKNFEFIWRECHKIKGCALNLTAVNLSKTAVDLENSGKANDQTGCFKNLSLLIREFDILEHRINDFKNEK